jgi:hypothetical protein
VAVPDELISCLDGPELGRRGDNMILQESELGDDVQGIQRLLGTRYLIYDDAAYAEKETIATGNHIRSRDPAKDHFSRAMNAPRTFVKWDFGLVQQHFPWVNDVAANTLAVTLLTNCITCAQ